MKFKKAQFTQTSREQHKLVPYLRLKKAQLKSVKYSFPLRPKTQKLDRIGSLKKGNPFGFCKISKKIEGGTLETF